MTGERVGFLWITPSAASTVARDHLEKLLAGLGDQQVYGDLVLVQRGPCRAPDSVPENVRLHVVGCPAATGLSKARNAGLDYARTAGLLRAAAVVAFPDDDCSYPPALLERVDRLVRKAPIVCGAYAPSRTTVDWERFPSRPQTLSRRLVMRAVSSNNVFFAARVVEAVGAFDERFGLGAPFGASEDADYVLRALEAGFRGHYRPHEVIVEHPYKSHRAVEYYRGNVAVLAKHAVFGHTGLSLARRLAVGACLAARGELPSREYARAVGAAARLLADSARGGVVSGE
jgi:glycosyltransferase involved in cell wall biosynthesis